MGAEFFSFPEKSKRARTINRISRMTSGLGMRLMSSKHLSTKQARVNNLFPLLNRKPKKKEEKMPPKAAKGKKDEPANQEMIARPASANDYQIVATVRSLQMLVNTDAKWRNRIHSAKRNSDVSHLKLQKLRQMVDTCSQGISKLNTEMDELIASLPDLPLASNNGDIIAQLSQKSGKANPAPPVPAAKAGAKGQVQVEEPTPSEAAIERRKAQCAHLGNILRSFYDMPRLQRERPPQRPSTAQDFLVEMEGATRLASPVDGTRAAAAATKNATAAAAPKGSKPPKATAAAPAEGSLSTSPFGDLLPQDYFPLPCPRGVDGKLLQHVLVMRSKRLRLESSIELFNAEMEPLSRRLETLHKMDVIGHYSVEAVQPKIMSTTHLEAELQKLRAQEDEQFIQAVRASSVSAPPPSGKK